MPFGYVFVSNSAWTVNPWPCVYVDKFNDGLQARQRFATPVLCDEREQPVLDLVPLARAGGRWATVIFNLVSSANSCKATFHNRQRALLLPPLSAVTSIPSHSGIGAAHPFPPTPNGVHGKRGRIVSMPMLTQPDC